MVCSICGGEVTWRGPLIALTHTQCGSCGEKNCQEVSDDSDGECMNCPKCAGYCHVPTFDGDGNETGTEPCDECDGTGRKPNAALTGERKEKL